LKILEKTAEIINESICEAYPNEINTITSDVIMNILIYVSVNS